MEYCGVYYTHSNVHELYHYGIPGMKWGVRKQIQGAVGRFQTNRAAKQNMTPEQKKAANKAKAKTCVKIGAAVAGTALAVYAAHKIVDFKRQSLIDGEQKVVSQLRINKNAEIRSQGVMKRTGLFSKTLQVDNAAIARNEQRARWADKAIVDKYQNMSALNVIKSYKNSPKTVDVVNETLTKFWDEPAVSPVAAIKATAQPTVSVNEHLASNAKQLADIAARGSEVVKKYR